MTIKLAAQASANRVLAGRARRLAATFVDSEDVAARLLRYADELDARAAELEQLAKDGGA